MKLGRRRLAIRQMDFPFDLRLGGGDLAHLRHHACGVLGVFVDAKTRALSLDPVLLILVLARLGRRAVRFVQRRRNPGRFRADKKVIRAVAHACDPDGWMDAIFDWHWRIPLLKKFLVALLSLRVRSRASLELEVVALRHQAASRIRKPQATRPAQQ